MTTTNGVSAQSLTSREFDLITRFRGIPEEAQERVMAIARGTVEPERHCAPCDRTDARIRAYAASLCDIRGVSGYNDDIEEARRRGLLLIERLAASADHDDSPKLRLDPGQVADVLAFIATHEPANMETWWVADDEISHVCGFYKLLEALEESLRGTVSAGLPSSTI